MAKLTNFIRDLWALLRPYWNSEERRSAWLLLIANIVLTLAMVYMTVLFNQWYNLFYNTLQDKAQDEFFRPLLRVGDNLYRDSGVPDLSEPDAADRGRSGCRRAFARFSCRSGPTFPSAPCARW